MGPSGLHRVDLEIKGSSAVGSAARIGGFTDAHTIAWGLCKGCDSVDSYALFVYGARAVGAHESTPNLDTSSVNPLHTDYFVHASPDVG